MAGLSDLRPYLEKCPRKSAQPRPIASVAPARDDRDQEALLRAIARVSEMQSGDVDQGQGTPEEALLREIEMSADKLPGDTVAQGLSSREQAFLLLDIATLDGKVRIVDAPLGTSGSPSDDYVACVQKALVGQVMPVRAAKAGSHMRMAFPLDLDPRAPSEPNR
jgi:hypothetical protein